MRRYECKLQWGKFQLNSRGRWSHWGQLNVEKGAQSGSGVSVTQRCSELGCSGPWADPGWFCLELRLDQRAFKNLPSLSFSMILSKHTQVVPTGFSWGGWRLWYCCWPVVFLLWNPIFLLNRLSLSMQIHNILLPVWMCIRKRFCLKNSK